MGLQQAIELAEQVDELYVFRGKKIVRIDLKEEDLDDESLGKLLLGPTGNLRAPTIRMKKTLLVGFNQEQYEKVLAG